MRRFVAILTVLLLIANTAEAGGPRPYYHGGHYYPHGCANCWIGPTLATVGATVLLTALLAPRPVIVMAPPGPTYADQRTPVPGVRAPMRSIGNAYLDERTNRVCRNFETEVQNREGFHDRVIRTFCEVDQKQVVELRRAPAGPVELHPR